MQCLQQQPSAATAGCKGSRGGGGIVKTLKFFWTSPAPSVSSVAPLMRCLLVRCSAPTLALPAPSRDAVFFCVALRRRWRCLLLHATLSSSALLCADAGAVCSFTRRCLLLRCSASSLALPAPSRDGFWRALDVPLLLQHPAARRLVWACLPSGGAHPASRRILGCAIPQAPLP